MATASGDDRIHMCCTVFFDFDYTPTFLPLFEKKVGVIHIIGITPCVIVVVFVCESAVMTAVVMCVSSSLFANLR